MKKLKIFLTYISSNRVWIITLACLERILYIPCLAG